MDFKKLQTISFALLLIFVIAFGGYLILAKYRLPDLFSNQNQKEEINWSIALDEDLINFTNGVRLDEKYQLSDQERADLIYLREEEKLAHDLYSKYYELWGLPVFDGISQSEQQHTDSLASLIGAYNVPDPIINGLGKFTDPKLQSLYEELLLAGSSSFEDALKTAATLEEIDIVDIGKIMENTENSGILIVYENLQRGSRNHLRAFFGTMEQYDIDYTPVYLSEKEYQRIVDSNLERGNFSSFVE